MAPSFVGDIGLTETPQHFVDLIEIEAFCVELFFSLFVHFFVFLVIYVAKRLDESR